ncbi:hypothetical protein MAR_004657 [Mya arenaria]|uniref:Uncharacterized protein n=1 Tax=Mya arenaria TaxID=6604 RepID=A0ABY7EYX7_MYAAR|nr:hypothetical protein MAR_004657 [Mya arenaria]
MARVSPVKMCKEGTLPVRILGVKDAIAKAKFLPKYNEITIDPEDGATFANDGDFIHENEKVKITIPEFCRVLFTHAVTKKDVELKASLKECVHFMQQ